MAKKMLIDATHPEETRVVVADGNKVDDFDFESITKRQLAGNIYLAKVTRVEPSLQAAFVEYGGNRHGFLAFSEIHPDYYQIPVADREALVAEEAREEEARRAREEEGENGDARGRNRSRGRGRRSRKDRAAADEAGASEAPVGLEVIDLPEGESAEVEISGESDVPRGLEIAVADAEEDVAADAGPLVSLEPVGADSAMETAHRKGTRSGARARGKSADPVAAPDVEDATEALDPPAQNVAIAEAAPTEADDVIETAPGDAGVEDTAEIVADASVKSEPAIDEPDAEEMLAEAPAESPADRELEIESPAGEEVIAAAPVAAEPEADTQGAVEIAAADPEPEAAEPAAEDEEDGEQSPLPPRTISEAAGLDDDDRVVGDLDGGPDRTITGDDTTDITSAEADIDPDAEAALEDAPRAGADAGGRVEPETDRDDHPTDETTDAVAESDTVGAGSRAGTQISDVPAPQTEDTADQTADADQAPEDQNAGDEPAAGEAGGAISGPEAPDDSGPVATEAEEQTPEDGEEAATEDEDDETDGRGRSKQRRSRRKRRGRGSRAAQEDDANDDTGTETEGETAVAGDAGENGDDSDDGDDDVDEPEQVGAEDTLEEAARARTRLRRRYKIQDVVKVRQIMLVQVVKEERGNKGAALTTYLSLAGRYCVLMPNTARGGGISRKITNAADRKRLREITGGLEVPQGMGLIVRTAGAERTKAEIKRDYEFLIRQWEQIRELTLKSIAPTLIYEEGSLIKRSIRDIYNKDIEQILVEGEHGYREAKEYMKMLMPSHAKNVQRYDDPIPLFSRYQVESYLNGMFNPTVQLKSGGYIVIGVTEALVAIDVNSGRATKQGSIEETALQTNLEAADEVARQLRLRDLAGLIVIDFIDMDENRNNRAVEKRMKDRLKTDRARIQVGRISAFGLMEMSRQRLRPGMLEATTQPCPACHGTGLIRSDESLSLSILREIEEEGLRGRANEIAVRAPIDVANYLINSKRQHIAQIEERHGISVAVLADPSLRSPEFEVERSKTQSRRPARQADVVTAGSVAGDEDLVDEVEQEREDEESHARRRRGKRGGRRGRRDDERDGDQTEADRSEAEAEGESQAGEAGDTEGGEDDERGRGRRRGGRRRGGRGRKSGGNGERRGRPDNRPAGEAEDGVARSDDSSAVTVADDAGPEADAFVGEAEALEATETAAPDDIVADAIPDDTGSGAEPGADASEAAEATVAEPVEETAPSLTAEIAAGEAQAEAEEAEAVTDEEEAGQMPPAPALDEPDKPKRRGWWSFGR